MNIQLKEDTVIQRSGEFLSSELNGETIMMSIKKGNYYSMPPHGTSIWKLIAEPLSISDLCKKLIEEYDVTYEDCLNDTLEFLAELVEQEIIISK